MKRIGVLSDTHGRLREEVAEILKTCDLILHAGDINTFRVLEQLKSIAPTYAVRGNADKEWAQNLPLTLDKNICGLHIFMVHNKKDMPTDMTGYDLAIYGHSHKYEEREEACYFLNPGSCGPRRFSLPVTMAVVEAEEGSFHVVRKDIVQIAENGQTRCGVKRGNGLISGASGETGSESLIAEKTLISLLRDVDKGKNILEITEKYKVDVKTAEQICRLYLTHPGINVAGVMDKMALPRDR